MEDYHDGRRPQQKMASMVHKPCRGEDVPDNSACGNRAGCEVVGVGKGKAAEWDRNEMEWAKNERIWKKKEKKNRRKWAKKARKTSKKGRKHSKKQQKWKKKENKWAKKENKWARKEAKWEIKENVRMQTIKKMFCGNKC